MDASASVLGSPIELVAVNDDGITVMVAGFPLKVPMGENENQEANLNISLRSITEHEVVIGVADVSHG